MYKRNPEMSIIGTNAFPPIWFVLLVSFAHNTETKIMHVKHSFSSKYDIGAERWMLL